MTSRIVGQPAGHAFTPKDRLRIGAVAFPVIFGIGGEVSPADAPAKAAESEVDRHSQLKAGENGVDPKNNGSQGLSLVAKLPEMIGDDYEYLMAPPRLRYP